MNNTELPFDNSPWIIPYFKNKGPSSYDVIRSLKRPIFNLLGKGKGRRKLKVGHFGTLDPFAEGLLLVGTGKALKLVSYFQNEMTKTYSGVGTIRFSTDTGDSEGQMLKESSFGDRRMPSFIELNSIAQEMLGEYMQSPPYFSAVKHEGRPLYEWAREGVYIEKPPVKRELFSFEVGPSKEQYEFEFKCTVSSGTYIRGLWVDLCRRLNLEGHLTDLKREKWGEIEESYALKGEVDALSYDQLKRADKLWKLEPIILGPSLAQKFSQGVYLAWDAQWPSDGHYFWVYDDEEGLLGLGIPYNDAGHKKLKIEVNLT